MDPKTPNEYMANELISIKSRTAFITFLATFWLGKYLMITWDNINGGIIQLWGAEKLTEEQLYGLDTLVHDFMIKYEENI